MQANIRPRHLYRTKLMPRFHNNNKKIKMTHGQMNVWILNTFRHQFVPARCFRCILSPAAKLCVTFPNETDHDPNVCVYHWNCMSRVFVLWYYIEIHTSHQLKSNGAMLLRLSEMVVMRGYDVNDIYLGLWMWYISTICLQQGAPFLIKTN